MAAEDLPSEFDVVILGTGLTESVVAAACSRVGQRVLHLDRRSFYAANWASFTFNGLLTWVQEHNNESQPEMVNDFSDLLENGEELMHLSKSDSTSITNLQVFCYTSEEEEDEAQCNDALNTTVGKEKTADEEALKESAGQIMMLVMMMMMMMMMMVMVVMMMMMVVVMMMMMMMMVMIMMLMFSRGSLVELLIKSNVSRYAEFKNVTRILTYHHGNVEQVPCSRADVFASRQLSVVEKRKLMRFLTSCMEETEEQQAYYSRPYLEFLHDQHLGDNLQHFLLHSIAMASPDTPTGEGLASTRHFLRCLGRYGNTPFLFPVYGLGEIPQCFCRMSAVFGGVYCLRHSVQCLIVDKDTNRCKAVVDSRGQRINCSHFVMEDGYLVGDRKKMDTSLRFLSRAVLITDASVLPGESDQQVSMVTVPSTDGSPTVRMVELCSSTMTCIPGTYLVHLTCQSVGSAHDDLSPVISRMFQTTKPDNHDQRPFVFWCLYFNMADGTALEVEGHDLPSNVYVCSGPDGNLGFERTIELAELIFKKMLPEEEFCPPAPNPEDIIYDGEPPSSTGGEEEQEGPADQEEQHEPEPLN
ncbi:rab proteins geranylgeranyltransferase component A 1-like [Nothobranchius furzeri]|uniref:Rab proteins geranylgeranyltransferase component A n=1 Tax=Nothobranchius furzeri TaxID=105023 RepID=A0A9D2XRN3_NOTFU|nr:rab proteins geranylgeranyltransferase component A 1-like [Nothobranchius furzeri]